MLGETIKDPEQMEAGGKMCIRDRLTCEMCLGEGTGAVAIFPLLQMAEDVYKKMSTFGEISIESYKELK